MNQCMSGILQPDWTLGLTFLKTAGFGSGGPKGGTSSLAVTDTCSHQINNSQILLDFILGRFSFHAWRVGQSWRETREHIVNAGDEWLIVSFVVFFMRLSTYSYVAFASCPATLNWQKALSYKHPLELVWFSHSQLFPHSSLVCSYLVCCVLCTRILNLHQHISVQEVRGDHVWNKRCGLFLKDCSHDVISYVPFPLQLKVGTEE